MRDQVVIDGSQGEGGGQIVRSSLALSILTGKSVTIENMRARRDKPGLMPQHLTAVNAAAHICDAQVSGAAVGASTLRFVPQPVKPGEYRFNIGTAGSATLVLQTVLPPLLVADATSHLVFEGGTHNPWAPPFEFVDGAYLPLVNRMGPHVTAVLERHGFYPAGGGRMVVSIDPRPTLRGFDLPDRGQTVSQSVHAIVANLPDHIAIREVEQVVQQLGWKPDAASTARVNAHGPGNAVWARIESEHVTEVFASFGRLGVRAEQVGEEVATQVQSYTNTRAAVGPYLADQLLLPLGISAWQAARSGNEGGGSFRTLPLSGHATTHIEILRKFLGIQVQVSADESTCNVSISK